MKCVSNSCQVVRSFAGVMLFAAAMIAPAQAAIQSLDAIRAAAEAHVRELIPSGGVKTIVTAGNLDPRLRLAPCEGKLQASAQNNGAVPSSRMTVGVRCSQGATWTVYVPVLIESEIPTLVLKRAVARGARISAEDVEVQTRRVSGTPAAYLRSIEELERQTAKRSLPAGSVLTADVLVPDYVVRRGQQVTLLASVGGVQVRMAGRALADGREGARLKAQNLSSLTVVEGVVEGEGVIRVSP